MNLYIFRDLFLYKIMHLQRFNIYWRSVEKMTQEQLDSYYF